MSKKRDQIKMTDDEMHEFIHGRRTMNIATIGADGRPHLVAMWYGFDADDRPVFETFAKSQKVVNLQRDDRITALIESGDTYEELRGVELVGTATVTDDVDYLRAAARSVVDRYWNMGDDESAIEMAVEMLTNKRVAVTINVEKVVSWDHRKLGGGY